VVLEEVFSHYFRLSGAGAGWTWITDHSDVFPGFDGIKRRRGFLEPWLLPIDDETLNEELRQEVIDDFGTKKVQFSDLLKKLDQAIDELQEQVKRDQAI
jgi:type II restriction/modification system DNA methylase subunit YeeA